MPTSPPRIPGIEVRVRGGRTTYRPRINRKGVKLAPVFTDLGAAISWHERATHAIDHGQPLPPLPGDPPARTPRAPAPARSGPTVAAASARLLAGIERHEIREKTGDTYKPATVRKYEGALRLDVIPHIGTFKLATVRRGDVQRLVDQLAAQRGTEQAKSALTALRVVVHMAERYGDIDFDPCAGVRVPRTTKEPREVPVLTQAQLDALLAAAERDDAGSVLRPPCSFILPMVQLGMDTALRHGEVLGLRWGRDGIDLDAGMVSVTQAIDRKLDPDQLEYRTIAPKSRTSRRRLPISPETAQAMRTHRMATGRPPDGALVWAQADGRPIPPQGKARSAWRRVRAAAGLPDLRFHDLRHNLATYQLAAGTSIHATADLLGHSDAGLVLRRYGHAMPDEIATSAQRLADYRAAQRTDSRTS